MTETIKTTAPVSSVGADGAQPYVKKSNEIIANPQRQINLQAAEKSTAGHFSGSATAKSPGESGQSGSLHTVSMTELYDTVYPPREPVADGFLYNGIYLFVGAGIPLWEYPVHRGTVLYLALEDDYARLQRRLSVMFGVESADNLFFATQAKTLNEGLDQQLEEFLKAHTDARLIIIDTLQKVREVGGDRYSYASDYEIVTRLKAFSDKYGICLLVVHHTRKLESDDSFDMISGTNGLLGAADGAFIMQKKKRTDNTAVMDIVGRDQPDQELTIEFDREQCVWKFQKAETELWKAPPDPALEAVAGLLSPEMPEWSGTSSELLERLPELGLRPNTLSRKLNFSKERLRNEYGIEYEPQPRTSDKRVLVLKLIREWE